MPNITQKKIKPKLIKSPNSPKTLKKSSSAEKLKSFSLTKSIDKESMSNPKRYNEDFIKILGELYDIMNRKGEPFRARAYKKAEETIIEYIEDITEPSQLKGLPGIGVTILDKLDEFVKTGKLQAIEKEKNNPLNILTKIYGIGPKKAQDFINAGVTTIKEMREQQDKLKLTAAQKVGLKHFDDIEKRIPRKEIKDFEKEFTKIFNKIVPPESTFDIVGSYRRGAKDSGDIDIIITNKNNDRNAFDNVLDKLIKNNIITDVLSRGKTKSLTMVQINKDLPFRRVDFLYTPPKEYPFALLYFTGSKIFNTIVRQKALNQKLTLNEHGLSHMNKGVKGDKLEQEFLDEKSILNFLGIEYKNPEERIDARSVVMIDDKKSIPEDSNIKETSLIIKPTKKNTTLKKPLNLTSSITELTEKFKNEGLSALKIMTEKELSDIIHKANNAYYCDDNSILTDNEYDIIREYTLEKYPKNIAAQEGHTSCDVNVGKIKVKLPYEMWSMDKIKPSTDAVEKWKKKYTGPYVVSAKLDGISALYVSEDGKAPKLYTRGNGREGQDISQMIPYLIKDEIKGTVVIRGEIIISKKVFQDKYSKHFANPRNFVAGVVNKKMIDENIIHDLDFVAYELIEPPLKPAQQLFDFGVKEIKHVKFDVKENISNDILSELLLDWRKDYEYEIDGIIVTNDEIYPRPKKNPEYAFAFKMIISDQVAEVKVVDIIWTPSKDGYLKPRVQIEPVVLGGAKIEYATGFNAKFIEDNKIGVGSLIQIIRSGDVIPHILNVVVPAEKPLFPVQEYKWNDTHVDIILLDKNQDETVREKNITGFFKGLEVDGIGPGNIKKIIATGYTSVPAIIAMTIDDLLKVDGFKEKTATKIYNNIHDKIDKASLSQLMHASNIFGRGFGTRRFTSILKEYPNILTENISLEEKITQLIQIDGIAKKTADKFVKEIPLFIEFMETSNLMDKLDIKKSSNVESGKEVIDSSHILYGKKIVFTGGKDKELIEEIKEYGAEEGSSVTKNTFVVIAKSKDEDTGKADKARKLDIPIITVNEFRAKYL